MRTPIGMFVRVRDRLMFGPARLFCRDLTEELEREPADVVVGVFRTGMPILNQARAEYGTVIKALAAGVPLVVAPLGRDQPDNAARVIHAGAGLAGAACLSLAGGWAELPTASTRTRWTARRTTLTWAGATSHSDLPWRFRWDAHGCSSGGHHGPFGTKSSPNGPWCTVRDRSGPDQGLRAIAE
ncbi:MAG: hypothetical protein ACRDP5_19760 [Streptosporangiaceae bacterium]